MLLSRSTVRPTAAVAILVWLTSCAPPKEEDYLKPDAAPAPEAPVPISVTPVDGSVDAFRKPVVRIKFDRQLDARTITQSRLDFVSGSLGKWTLSFYNPVNRELVVWTSSSLFRQTTWFFRIEMGVLGMNGYPVHPAVMTTFRTGDDKGDEQPFVPRSFEKEVFPILKNHCTSCHGGSDKGVAGLKLDSKEHIEQTALGIAASGWRDWKRIVPTRPGLSFLLFKISDYEYIPGQKMPRGIDEKPATTLTMEEKMAIAEWIAQGANFFDPPAEDE